MIERALILSAGQGRRLLPFTLEQPKCLLRLNARPLILWQIDSLIANGIRDITIVTGFGADQVEALLRTSCRSGVKISTIFNPFYEVADNIGSCFLARAAMLEDGFVLINGDTLFHPRLFAHAVEQAKGPITVTVDKKAGFDDDDMKVQQENGRLLAIGKELPLDVANAESIGMLFFSAEGGARFAAGIETALHQQSGLKYWYLSVIDRLARDEEVGVAEIHGYDWCEVDYPKDLTQARRLTARLRQELSASEDAYGLAAQIGEPA